MIIFKILKKFIFIFFFTSFSLGLLILNKYFYIFNIIYIILFLIIANNFLFKFFIKSNLFFTIIFTIIDLSIFFIFINLPLPIKVNNILGIKKYLIFFSIFLIVLFKFIILIKKFIESKVALFHFFLFIFLIILLINIWQNTFHYYGDEPYYLLITHSISYDFDVDLKNNYENNDYSNFYNFHLRKQPSYEKNNKIYSSHFIGLPILLALPYKFLGKQGVILIISFISTLFIYLFYKFVYLYFPKNSSKKIFILVLILLFTAPFLEMYSSIYPEIPAACIFLILFIDYQKNYINLFKHSFAFLFLALLGIKYLPAALFIWFLLAINYYKNKKLFLFCFLTLLMILIHQSIIFYAYGEFKPFGIAFSHSKDSNNFSLSVFPTQFFKLLFGQRYGLFFCAPIYILAIYSFIKNIKFFYLQFFIFFIHAFPFFMLDGVPGDSPPARYFIAALPFLTFYLFLFLYQNFFNNKYLKYLFYLLYTINTIYSLFYLVLPFYRNKTTGYNNFIYFIKTYIFN